MLQYLSGFLCGVVLMCVLVNYATESKFTPEQVERNAARTYEDWAKSKDWYDKAIHLEPWSRLSDDEKEQWRRPLRRYDTK